jgi:protein-S-isoprenylcysteine O-methyltransferase Ste14
LFVLICIAYDVNGGDRHAAFSILEKFWLLLGFFWLLTAIGQKRAVFRESAGRSAGYRVGTVVGFVLLFADWAAVGALGWRLTPHRPAFQTAALAIGIAGFALAFWARILLGGEWSSQVTLKTDHRLIVAGPYAWVRHPIYSGLLLAIMGTAMAGGQLRMYLAILVLFVSLWYKSRLEEQLLVSAMGARYLDYQRHTYALIPGLL